MCYGHTFYGTSQKASSRGTCFQAALSRLDILYALCPPDRSKLVAIFEYFLSSGDGLSDWFASWKISSLS